jgi:ribosomal protein S25
MTDWLGTLLESTKEAEAPDRYFWWAGLCAISAVIRKKVYLQRGAFYKLYPNIYVALVSARSGLRKGIPIMVAKKLVTDLDSVRVISGCSSIQALTKELSQQQTFRSGAVVNEAQGLMISDEFESFITKDELALTYLTALHNTHEHEESWKKRLKGSPLEELKSPCLTLLVASNEALFESMVKQKDIEGGFIARTFIVYESKRKRINDLMYTEEEIVNLLENDTRSNEILSSRLKEINKLSGKMTLSVNATRLYRSWYEQLAISDYDDRTGSMDRLGDQVLKVAMLISVSNNNSLIIDESDLTKAIDASELCMMGARTISREKEKGDINIIIKKVLDKLIEAPEQIITRKRLLNVTHIETILIDRALDTLVQRGAIDEPKRNSKKEIFYKMKQEVYDKYTKFHSSEKGRMN